MSALLLSTLGVVCPSCDLFHPPGSARCAECAAELVPARPPAKPAPRPAAMPPARPPTSPPLPGRPPVGRAPTPPLPVPATSLTPPGMRPSSRSLNPTPLPGTHAQPVVRSPGSTQAPIPASELLKKPAAAPRPPAPSRFGLSVIAGQVQGQRFRLGGAGCMVGRAKGAILFPDDPHVSPHHGTFLLKDGKLFVRDEASLSGVFVTTAQERLRAGSYFAAGSRLFRYTGPVPPPQPPPAGRPQVYGAPVPQGQVLHGLEEILVGGRSGRAVVTGGPLLTIGQQHCDLSYPGEAGLALRHCELAPSGDHAVLKDLSSGLGTWVRIPAGAERPLSPGDRVRIGQQVLQVDLLG